MSGGYHIPPELALFRIVPKHDEKDDENFPRNLGEAVMLFLRTQKKACADEVVTCIQNLLEILAKGHKRDLERYMLKGAVILTEVKRLKEDKEKEELAQEPEGEDPREKRKFGEGRLE